MKRDMYSILERPVVTEKSQTQNEVDNKVAFVVRRDANKIEIAKAVEAIYNVQVVSVRTLIMHGKNKRVGKRIGRLPNWKKAVVTLAPESTVEFFEGA